jgi:16S rRNA (guanine966-N2)-methyltransferase
MLRIITGRLKGRRVPSPEKGVRPTPQKVRSALFNILYSRGFPLSGAVVLDLYCGTGSVGLEAISRGAEKGIFVDISRKILKKIEAFGERAGIRDRIVLVQAELPREVHRIRWEFSGKVDLVFLDPPFSDPAPVHLLLESEPFLHLLSDSSLIVYESHRSAPPPYLPSYEEVDLRRYSQILLRFFQPLPRKTPDRYLPAGERGFSPL